MCTYLIHKRVEALRNKFEMNAHVTYISSLAYAELCFGAVHSARVESNRQELSYFCHDFDILSFDSAAGVHYGEIRQALTQCGRIIAANDLLIAARARSADATLVTNS